MKLLPQELSNLCKFPNGKDIQVQSLQLIKLMYKDRLLTQMHLILYTQWVVDNIIKKIWINNEIGNRHSRQEFK